MTITAAVVAGFLAATVRVATPLLFAATGELVAERSGVINLGVEGAMLAGALAAAIGAAAGGPWTGLALGLGAGLLVAALFAAVAVGAGADQIIAGTAVTLGAVGLTGAGYRLAFGSAGAGLGIPTLGVVRVPALARLPLVGEALFAAIKTLVNPPPGAADRAEPPLKALLKLAPAPVLQTEPPAPV